MADDAVGPEANEPEPSRPRLFGGHPEPSLLPWAWAADRLVAARHYWIATTRANGDPHSRPVWGVWLDGALFFSTGSLAARNLVANPAITAHLESGGDVVILEGVAEPVADGPLLRRVVAAYNAKYRSDLDPANPPGPFSAVRSRHAFGWLSDPSGLDRGAAFHGTATRWTFPPRSSRAPASPREDAPPPATPAPTAAKGPRSRRWLDDA